MGVLFGAVEGDGEALHQLVLHCAVGVELEAEDDYAKLVRIGQAVGEHAVIELFAEAAGHPEVHYLFPAFARRCVAGGKLSEQGVYLILGLRAEAAVIDCHFLDNLIGTLRVDAA